MKTRKNASVELIRWRNSRKEHIYTVGMALREDATHLAVFATHGSDGWIDRFLIKKKDIVERHELDVVEK